MSTTKSRLIGVEVEYKNHSEDRVINPENEYYNGMKEINRLLLPMHAGKTIDTLKTVRNVLVGINGKLRNRLGTYGWSTGYGYAFNGLHLHISHDIDTKLLEENILRVIDKWGITPRIATSWHIRQQKSLRSFKNKKKYRPIFVTPRGTVEIRVLDIEYFYDDEILADIAMAIDYSSSEILDTVPFGSSKWFYQSCMNEDYGRLLNVMEKNLAPWYKKVDKLTYINEYTNDLLCYTSLYESHKAEVNGAEYKDALKADKKTRSKSLSPTKVADIFDINDSSSSDDTHMAIVCGSKEMKLAYDVRQKMIKSKLEVVPLASALNLCTKVGGKSYSVIPNDVFYYLGINVNSRLSIESQTQLESYIESKLDELLVPLN